MCRDSAIKTLKSLPARILDKGIWIDTGCVATLYFKHFALCSQTTSCKI